MVKVLERGPDKPPMLLRNFAPTDLGEVMSLVSETFKQDYFPSMYLTLHAHWPEGFLVASEDGKIAGLILGTRVTPEEARILIMVTRKEMRNKGVGSSLLKMFHDRCGEVGVSRIVLEVRGSNTNAQGFYSKRGFQTDSMLSRYYLDGENGVKMVKWI